MHSHSVFLVNRIQVEFQKKLHWDVFFTISGQGFTEQRKQKAIHQYKKLQRKEQKVKGADRQGQGVAPKKSLPHRKPHSRPVQGTAAVKKGGAGRGQGGGAGRQVAKQHPSKPRFASLHWVL